MSSLNKVMIIGNLTREPELKTTPNGAQVCELGLAMNRSWTGEDGQKNDEVTFVDVTVWGKTAQNAATYLAKGRSVFVEGRLQLDSWQDKESGKQRSKLRIVGERLQFLSGGNADGGQGSAPQRGRHPVAQAA